MKDVEKMVVSIVRNIYRNYHYIGTTIMDYGIEIRSWKVILSYLKTVKGLHNKNEEKLRVFVEAVWYAVRTGVQWHLLPACYGKNGERYT